MADLTRDMLIRISQEGGEEVAGTFGKISTAKDQDTQATKRNSTETQGLSKWIRAQRTEQREQNFLFREGRNAISAVAFATIGLASATGGSSKEMQKMNQVLVSGYSGFQAVGFAMAGLGIATGGVSIAISALVGGGAALLAFLGNASKEEEELAKQMKAVNDEMTTFLLQSDLISGKEKTNVLGISKGQVENEIKAADSAIKDLQDRIAKRKTVGILDPIGSFKALGLEDELQQKMLDREQLYIKWGRAQQNINKDTADQLKSEKDLNAVIEARFRAVSGFVTRQKKGLGEFGKDSPYLPDVSLLKPLPWEDKLAKDSPFEKNKARIDDINVRLMTEKLAQTEINTLVAERTRLMEDQDRLMGKTNKKTKDSLDAWHSMASAMGSLRSGLEGIGVATDSWLGKLISVLQVVTSIKEALTALETISFILSGGSSAIPGIAGASAGGSTGASPEFQSYLRKPQNREALIQELTDMTRKRRS